MDELGPHADLKEPGRGRYPGNAGYKIRLEVDEGRLFSGNDQLNVRDGVVMCQIVSELGHGNLTKSSRFFKISLRLSDPTSTRASLVKVLIVNLSLATYGGN
jgi:hypothetical protein